MTERDGVAFDALHDIALLIAAETELDGVLAQVLRATEALLRADSASVFLRSTGGAHGGRFTTLETGQPHWERRSEEVRPGGVTDTVLADGVAVAIEDMENDKRASSKAKALRSRAVLAAPLRCQGEVIGVLYANFDHVRSFGIAERNLAETLGAYAATAVRNARLIDAERNLAQRQAGLLNMARALSSSLDLHAVCEQLTGHGRALLGADEVSLHRLRSDGSLYALYQDPVPDGSRREPWMPDAFIQGVLDRRAAALIQRPADDPATSGRWVEHLRGVELAAAVPIQTDRELIGVLICLWRTEREPGDVDLALLETVGRHAAIAAQNARAHEQAVAGARLDGAIKTAQAAAHELSQPLSVIVGYSEAMEFSGGDTEQLRTFATLIGRAGKEASRKLDQFRRVLRYVELQFGDLDPILDLERSSSPLEDRG